MKNFGLLILIIFSACLMRVDWDNLDKPNRKYSYEYPHEGNLSKSENSKNAKDSAANKGVYTIQTNDSYKSENSTNCVTIIAKCLSHCNLEHDINSASFVFKVAFIHTKRSICYDKCYSGISPACDYPFKKIQY